MIFLTLAECNRDRNVPAVQILGKHPITDVNGAKIFANSKACRVECVKVPECTHWVFCTQTSGYCDGQCFLKSAGDGGENKVGVMTGPVTC